MAFPLLALDFKISLTNSGLYSLSMISTFLSFLAISLISPSRYFVFEFLHLFLWAPLPLQLIDYAKQR